uniref:Serine/threonineprotein kinase 32Clike [Takifugu rubripes] n=1 Tax=Lepeophtheirus salmonis TaxID=72036 RepID=A0A0K2TDL4_LEPSM
MLPHVFTKASGAHTDGYLKVRDQRLILGSKWLSMGGRTCGDRACLPSTPKKKSPEWLQDNFDEYISQDFGPPRSPYLNISHQTIPLRHPRRTYQSDHN